MAPHPLIGAAAPPLSLPDADGNLYTLGIGKQPVCVFFYPKSGTYGCTREACEFRDKIAGKETFNRANVEVVGVSADPVAKQKSFVDEHKLTFPVLSDEKGEARKAYSVGKSLMGMAEGRVTFIIDETGIVRDVLDTALNFSAHSKFVDKWLDKFKAEKESVPTA